MGAGKGKEWMGSRLMVGTHECVLLLYTEIYLLFGCGGLEMSVAIRYNRSGGFFVGGGWYGRERRNKGGGKNLGGERYVVEDIFFFSKKNTRV